MEWRRRGSPISPQERKSQHDSKQATVTVLDNRGTKQTQSSATFDQHEMSLVRKPELFNDVGTCV